MDKRKKTGAALLTVILSVIAVAVVFTVIVFRTRGNDPADSCFYSMDTLVEIVGGGSVKNDVKSIFTEAENIFDMHDDESELSKLNQAGKLDVSKKLSKALSDIKALNKKYGDGADVTVGALTKLWDINGSSPKVPSDSEIKKALETVGYENIKISGDNVSLENSAVLDLGCAAKGLTLDHVKELLDKKNAGKTIVSAGGSSILLYGSDSFKTGILSPDDESRTIGRLYTSAGVISTSGGYRRFTEIDGKSYIHIIDTETGRPSESDLTSVTVFCENGLESDFLSTLIFTGGTADIKKYLSIDGITVVACDKEKNVYASKDAGLELTDEDYTLIK